MSHARVEAVSRCTLSRSRGARAEGIVLVEDERPPPMGTEATVTAAPWPPGWEDEDDDDADPDDWETL